MSSTGSQHAAELDIERGSDVPISTQIYWQLAYQIESGRLQPGTRLAPVRDLVNGIIRSESELLNDRTTKYFKDVHDHIIQAHDLSENYRDIMVSMQDLYINNVNLKMNEVMKVMAIVTCLLAPATVIGGIFGMNFESIPYLHNEYGFWIAVTIMLIIPIWMIFAFRKRGWF